MPRRTRPLLLIAALCTPGCAPSVIPEFNAARDAALADPGPAPQDWEPDAVVTLSERLVDEALEDLLDVHGKMESAIDVGPLKATPKLKVTGVELSRARCADCLGIKAELGGHLKVSTPLGAVKAPVSAMLDFDAVFGLDAAEDTWTLTIAPKKVRQVDVDVAGADFSPLTQPLTSWVSDALAQAGPLPVADLGSSALPIRGMKVSPAGRDLRLQLLTATPDPVAVREPDGPPGEGWRLDLATDTLLDLARKATFQAEPLPHSIVPEPTSLIVTDDTFVLGLRLWHVKGRGWWRDYDVHGHLKVQGNDIELTPQNVDDVARSRGAAWADPLAALAQGAILKALERALETSVPAVHRDKGEKVRLVVTIEAIEGREAVVVAHGGLKVTQPKR